MYNPGSSYSYQVYRTTIDINSVHRFYTMQLKHLLLFMVIIAAVAVMPVSAVPTKENIAQLRADTKLMAPSVQQWSLPYTVLTAADIMLEQGYNIEDVQSIVGEHYTNAITIQQQRGRISANAADRLRIDAFMIAYT